MRHLFVVVSHHAGHVMNPTLGLLFPKNWVKGIPFVTNPRVEEGDFPISEPMVFDAGLVPSHSPFKDT